MRKLITQIVCALLSGIVALSADAGVTKRRLGSLLRSDLVVTDVDGGGSTGSVTQAIEEYDTSVIRPREVTISDAVHSVSGRVDSVEEVVYTMVPSITRASAGVSELRSTAQIHWSWIRRINGKADVSLLGIRRLGRYLFVAQPTIYSRAEAIKRIENVYNCSAAMCSGVCNNRYHGRNLDWTYDTNATVVVRAPASETRLGLIGVSSGVMDPPRFEDGIWHDEYYSIPFTLSDGMNECGVVIQQNVIPRDDTKSAKWRTWRARHIILFAAIRCTLESCHTAKRAAEMLRDFVFIPDKFAYDIHYLVSDRTSSYIVEDGVILTGKPADALTNFRIASASFDSGNRVIWETVEPYGNGVERYEYIRTNELGVSTFSGILGTMTNLWYTKTYLPETRWYTEYCTANDARLTVMNAKTNSAVFADEVAAWHADYKNEHTEYGKSYRAGKTWQTTTTTVYDKERLEFVLYTQEDPSVRWSFKLREFEDRDQHDDTALE